MASLASTPASNRESLMLKRKRYSLFCIFSYQVFVILSYHYSEGDILLDVMIPNTKLATIFPGFVMGRAKFNVGSQWRNIVLQWLISVGRLHSRGDKEPSILGSFSFVRLKFQSGVAFWWQNVRQVTSSYPSPAKLELTTWYNSKSQIPRDKKHIIGEKQQVMPCYKLESWTRVPKVCFAREEKTQTGKGLSQIGVDKASNAQVPL